jgi:hypothetical protein
LRIISTIGLALVLSTSGWAQTTTAMPLYQEGSSVLDGAGNLVVFDMGRSTTGVTVTGMRHSFYAPQTRVTIQHPGTTGNIQTVTYDAGLRVIGVGDAAIYAIATMYTVSGTTVTTTQSLIAIKAGQTLPTGLSGFPSLALTSPVEARVGPSDYLALVSEPARVPGTATTTTTTRTAQVVHFNGTSFETTSSGTLP